MASEKKIKRILISRIDSIGDVVLTLPLCGLIKAHNPDVELLFLGRAYTKPVIDCCTHIEQFIDWSELEKLPVKKQIHYLKDCKIDAVIHVFPNPRIAKITLLAGIDQRVGTTGRIYHWLYCNRLIFLSRKSSDLHEAELNINLAKEFVSKEVIQLSSLKRFYGFTKIPSTVVLQNLIEKEKYNLILHPKSKGSAREWPLEKYKSLIDSLPQNKYNIFISGTSAEGDLLKEWIKTLPEHIHNITGQLSLPEFISFISRADGLIAASTGPLHIAAALGIFALGLYPPIRPMDPQRWAPLGEKAHYLVLNKSCNSCRDSPSECSCMKDLEVEQVLKKLLEIR